MLNVKGVKDVKAIQKIAVEQTRLHIPLLFGFDVIHGYKTISPIPLAEAASWDLNAIKKSAEMAAEEASSVGINWTFAPMVDVSRDARWGRVMEGAGEDPFLGSKIAVARVQGFQGDLKSNKNINLSSIELVLIIQNRCIETWLLGNQNFVLTQTANIPLKYSQTFLTYRNYYDVRNQDPELMGIYDGSKSITHAQFHEEYLKSVFRARELSYSKGKSKEVGEKFYLDELIKRITVQPNHLNSFQYFLSIIKNLQKH